MEVIKAEIGMVPGYSAFKTNPNNNNSNLITISLFASDFNTVQHDNLLIAMYEYSLLIIQYQLSPFKKKPKPLFIEMIMECIGISAIQV